MTRRKKTYNRALREVVCMIFGVVQLLILVKIYMAY